MIGSLIDKILRFISGVVSLFQICYARLLAEICRLLYSKPHPFLRAFSQLSNSSDDRL